MQKSNFRQTRILGYIITNDVVEQKVWSALVAENLGLSRECLEDLPQ